LKEGTVVTSLGDRLRATKVQIDGVALAFHKRRRLYQNLRVIGTELETAREKRRCGLNSQREKKRASNAKSQTKESSMKNVK
jgi:hypothetical protein